MKQRYWYYMISAQVRGRAGEFVIITNVTTVHPVSLISRAAPDARREEYSSYQLTFFAEIGREEYDAFRAVDWAGLPGSKP